MFLPDARFELPELLTPGLQPIGNLVINYDNELSRNLRVFYIASHDLVLGMDKLPTSPSTGSVGSDNDGLFYNVPTNDYITLDTHVSGADAMSVYGRVRHNGGSTNGAVVSTEQGYNGAFFVGRTSSTGVQVWRNAVKTETGSNTFPQDEWHNIGFAMDGRLDIYIDGESSTWSLTTVTINTHSEIRIGQAPTLGLDLDTKWMGIWDRALTAEEIRSMDKDPYQLVIPA